MHPYKFMIFWVRDIRFSVLGVAHLWR